MTLSFQPTLFSKLHCEFLSNTTNTFFEVTFWISFKYYKHLLLWLPYLNMAQGTTHNSFQLSWKNYQKGYLKKKKLTVACVKLYIQQYITWILFSSLNFISVISQHRALFGKNLIFSCTLIMKDLWWCSYPLICELSSQLWITMVGYRQHLKLFQVAVVVTWRKRSSLRTKHKLFWTAFI